MINQTSILTDIDLDVVAGGFSITQMAAAGVQGAASGTTGKSFFKSTSMPTTPKTKSCSSNHNGVHY